MKKVILRAPLLTYSGYGTHSRQIFKWLISRPDLDVYTAIVPWGITTWMVNPDIEDGLVENIMKRSVPEDTTDMDVSIQVQLPNEWNHNLARKNIGVSAFVETDICNPRWIEDCNRMDHVIVPSTHIKDVITRSAQTSINTPIDVVHESFYEQVLMDCLDDSILEFSTSFNFLVFGQITGSAPDTDRKNLYNTIKWICEEFKDDPDVGIVLKTNSGRNSKIDKKITTKMVKSLVREVRQGPYPKVHLVHGTMNQEEVSSLYTCPSIKALVSFTRGEGFGLPILEAAASGLPVIATDWSGHLDFMNLGRFISVNFSLREVPNSRIDNHVFMQGSKWAEVHEESAKIRLRKFRKSPNIPTQWASELKCIVREKFSQDSINLAYNEVLGKYL